VGSVPNSGTALNSKLPDYANALLLGDFRSLAHMYPSLRRFTNIKASARDVTA